MDTLSLLRGFRFIDTLFPSGGYAFSSGLEAAAHDGAVTDADGLQRYVADLLEHGMAAREAVAVARAHAATRDADLHVVIRTDRELDAMKLDRATRLASRQMGRQVIRIAADSPMPSLVNGYVSAVARDQAPGHLAVSLGVTLASFGWPVTDAVAAFLYQTASGLVSAGMKLLPLGQRESQRLLDGWLPLIDRIASRARAVEQMASFTPVQDIYAMRHSRLPSRLFRS